MNLIALETSTENCSVALLHKDKITHRSVVAPQKHAELVLGFLQTLLDEKNLQKSDLDGIVFGQGPGAFTGVRIAMSIVQGLALALEIPVLAVSTLHNIAYQIMHSNHRKPMQLLIANDARMGEVYWATFMGDEGGLNRINEDALSAPEDINTQGFDVCAGSAFKTMINVTTQCQVLDHALPDANTLLIMAQNRFKQEAKNIIEISPTYIREKVVFN